MEDTKRTLREAATRRLLGIGGKARGKHAPRSHAPRGTMVGSIHPDLAIQRAERKERNAQLRALGLPIPKPDIADTNSCVNLAFIVVTVRQPKPQWKGHNHGKGRCDCHSTIAPDMALPPIAERSMWRAPSDPTTYIPAMIADCKRFGVILTRTASEHTREIRGTGIAIEAMLRISPDWCASWQYGIDAAIGRGAAGAGPIGVGAKRRIAEGKREIIAKAEDRASAIERIPAPMQPDTRDTSDRNKVAAYLATFGITDFLTVVSWERDIMGKRDIPLLDDNGKPRTDTYGNILLMKDVDGRNCQEYYKVKTVVDTTTAESVATRLMGYETILQHLAAIVDDAKQVQAIRDDAERRLTALIAEFKVWIARLEAANTIGGK